MTDMIERVAKAVKRCNVFPLGDLREYLSNEDAITIARAAIEAMREPSEEMVDQCMDMGIHAMTQKAVWEKMLDAALEEK